MPADQMVDGKEWDSISHSAGTYAYCRHRRYRWRRDRDRLTTMGECARELVLRHYNVENAVKGTIQAVEAALGQDRSLVFK